MKKMFQKPNYTGVIALLIFSALFAASFSSFAAGRKIAAGDTVQTIFTVKGTSACKATIEALAISKQGVLSAVWNAGSGQMTVTYLPAAVEITAVYEAIALGG